MAEKNLKLNDIQKLLDGQTKVILNAVDEKLQRTDAKITAIDQRLAGLEERISRLEIKVDKRFDQLITTLDKFLKRLTDIEDEFEMMKLDLNRVKKVIQEKLGVDLT